MNLSLKVLFLSLCHSAIAIPACQDPEIRSVSYTTEDVTILTHIAYISEFTVRCGSGSVSNLYALIKGAVSPVGVVAPDRYQISWTEEVKTARTGDVSVNIYDEDGYLLLRKAQRTGEGVEGVPVLGKVRIHHPGTYKGPWISCECVAVAFSLVVCYYAIHFRAKLL